MSRSIQSQEDRENYYDSDAEMTSTTRRKTHLGKRTWHSSFESEDGGAAPPAKKNRSDQVVLEMHSMWEAQKRKNLKLHSALMSTIQECFERMHKMQESFDSKLESLQAQLTQVASGTTVEHGRAMLAYSYLSNRSAPSGAERAGKSNRVRLTLVDGLKPFLQRSGFWGWQDLWPSQKATVCELVRKSLNTIPNRGKDFDEKETLEILECATTPRAPWVEVQAIVEQVRNGLYKQADQCIVELLAKEGTVPEMDTKLDADDIAPTPDQANKPDWTDYAWEPQLRHWYLNVLKDTTYTRDTVPSSHLVAWLQARFDLYMSKNPAVFESWRVKSAPLETTRHLKRAEDQMKALVKYRLEQALSAPGQ